MNGFEKQLSQLLETDPYLIPYSDIIKRRLEHIELTEQRLTQGQMTLWDFASGHEFFGLHFETGNGFSVSGHQTQWQSI